MQGRNLSCWIVAPRAGATCLLRNVEFITGRGLRTPQYTYAAAAPKVPGWKATPTVDKYVEYMLYDLYSDPYQQVNLAGRTPYQKISTELRQRLRARMQEASEEQSAIEPAWFPYS